MRSATRESHVTTIHDAGAPAVELRGLTKRFKDQLAVDDVSFQVPTIFGTPFHELDDPARTVGSIVDNVDYHPGRKAIDERRISARTAGLPRSRCDEVLELVGLQAAATKRVGQFGLGMRQRMGLAQALLGDPKVLLLDEPANGLDPEGIHWVRQLLRHLAEEGRAILVSSHLLGEVSRPAAPSRTKVLTAKLLVGVVYGLVFFVLGLVVVGVLLAVSGESPTFGAETWASPWQGPVGLALTAMPEGMVTPSEPLVGLGVFLGYVVVFTGAAGPARAAARSDRGVRRPGHGAWRRSRPRRSHWPRCRSGRRAGGARPRGRAPARRRTRRSARAWP